MKQLIISLIISLSIFTSLSTRQVAAKIITGSNGNVQVMQGETVDDDLFMSGQSVAIDGIVNGDVFVGAQAVRITGTINGNLHVGANTLFLGGTVTGNVYAGAQNILINSGKIGGSLLAGAAVLDVDNNSSVGGSIMAGAGTVNINAPVKRNIFVGTNTLTLGQNAKIGKDLYYAVGNKKNSVMISESAQIEGTVHKKIAELPKKKAPSITKSQAVAAFSFFNIASTMISFLATLIVGFLYMKLFLTESAEMTKLIKKSFWKCFGIGLLFLITLIPGIIFLVVTIIGIPLVGLVLLLAGLFAYLSSVVVGIVAGEWITQKLNQKIPAYGSFVLGLTTLYLLKIIPVVGFLTGMVVLWVGMGAFTIRLFTKK